MCIQLDPQNWLYTSYCELGRYKEAQECLSLIKDDVVPPQMDYGYSMCVKLYKGLVKPEEFIDEEKMAKVVLPRENRVLLEENTMLYGLYWYWMVHGNEEEAKKAIKRLLEIAYPGAFGYSKGLPIAKKLGLSVLSISISNPLLQRTLVSSLPQKAQRKLNQESFFLHCWLPLFL